MSKPESSNNNEHKICRHHNCNNKINLHKCKYCDKLFCEKHLIARPAGIPNFKSITPEDKRFIEERRIPGGHACIPYAIHWLKKHENKERRYREGLDRFLRKRPSEYEDYEPKHNNEPKVKSKLPKIILITLSIIAVVLLLTFVIINTNKTFYEKHHKECELAINNITEDIKTSENGQEYILKYFFDSKYQAYIDQVCIQLKTASGKVICEKCSTNNLGIVSCPKSTTYAGSEVKTNIRIDYCKTTKL